MGIFLVNDSQTPPPFKNDNLGLLQIHILHLTLREGAPPVKNDNFGIIADSYSTPSKTSRNVISYNKNVIVFKAM